MNRACYRFRTPGPALQHTPARTRGNRYGRLLSGLAYTVASAACVVLILVAVDARSVLHLVAAGIIAGGLFAFMCRAGLPVPPAGYTHFGRGDD